MRKHYIYKYTNKINGKCYIGQTVDIKRRCREEKYKTCTKFYNAIKKYGWDSFDFEILCECLENEVDEQERYFIALYDSIKNGYNLESGGCANKIVSEETKRKISESEKGHTGYNKGKPAWNRGISPSEETRLKLSISHKGQRQPLSEDTKRKISEAQIGKIISEETRERLRQSHKGKPSKNRGKTFSAEWRQHLSEAHLGQKVWNKSIPCAEETKQKISIAKKGVYYDTSKKVKNIETGEIYMCAKEAEDKTGINHTNIYAVCKGTRKVAGGYHWQYV